MNKLSVIIPTYNRANLLESALNSLVKQTISQFDIIVSDNCSTDNTSEVVNKFKDFAGLKYFRNSRNLGMVKNWEVAILERCNTEWFILLSDDDVILDPGYLGKVIDILRTNDIKFLCSGGIVYDESTRKSSKISYPFDGLVKGKEFFLSRGTIKPQDIILSSMVFKVSDVKRLGFLKQEFNLSCDSEFCLKLSLEGDVFIINESATLYRLHSGNLVKKIRKYREYAKYNLDHLVNPYAAAKEFHYSPSELLQFRKSSGMDRAIANTLLLMRLNNKDWFLDCNNYLAAQIPIELHQIKSSFIYKFKSIIFRTFSPVLRLKYSMSEILS